MNLNLHNADCNDIHVSCDLVFTDPPFELPGSELASIFKSIDCNHFVLLTTLKQYTELIKFDDSLKLSFDFVLDIVAPKKSKSIAQPNYTHVTGVYLTRGASSIFNRKRRERSDTFDGNGYWPTILQSPRKGGYGKDITAVTDLIGSFSAKNVYDPFLGTGTTAVAAFELGLSEFTGCEIDPEKVEVIIKKMEMLGVKQNT